MSIASSSALSTDENKYIARIELNTVEELQQLLQKADAWAQSAGEAHRPIAFVLHGKEAEVLLTSNYSEFQSLVDLAKDLDSRDVVDIQVCRTWMSLHGHKPEDFEPFVQAIPYAPSEIERLVEEGYVYF